jgi:hypothetical protein
MHLPLAEAAAAAQSQLSAEGRIAQLPSRRLLIINDDSVHIDRARTLLRQLDRAPAQLSVHVEIAEREESDTGRLALSGKIPATLPGGWIRLDAAAGSSSGSKRRDFMLRASSGATGHIEAGEIHPVLQSVRQYLGAHGIVAERNVELLNITGGFDVRPVLLRDDQVRLSIHPWLKELAPNPGMDTTTGVRIDSGGIQAGERVAYGSRIMLAEAATELTLRLGERVVLAANSDAAREFSNALFGVNAVNRHGNLSITISVKQIGDH